MSEESGLEKSHEATPERLKKARQKGNVPVSVDVNTALAMVGIWIGVAAIGGGALYLATRLAQFYWYPEALSHEVLSGAYSEGGLFRGPFAAVSNIIAPGAVLVVIGLLAQQAIVFAPTKIKFDLSRVDPIKGLKRRYGPSGMTEFFKASLKITLAAVVGGAYIWSQRDTFITSVYSHADAVPSLIRQQAMNVFGLAVVISAAVAMIDLPLKRFEHAKQLRMTRQEVADETKENEGDPVQKQSRKKRAEALTTNRMLTDTQQADVVIVNPTHYAVALKWDRATDTVPICVAKGVDHLAHAIIERARQADVPVREDPPSARALYATVDIGAPIRPEHFVAVAAAIRFADAVGRDRGSIRPNT